MDFQINYLATALAAFAYMGIGALWFSKALFGVPWAKEVGKNVSDLKISNNKKGLIFPAIGSLSGAYFLSVLVKSISIEGVWMSMVLGLIIGIAFIGTALMSNYYFMGRTKRHFVIDTGYHVVAFVVMGMIIGLSN